MTEERVYEHEGNGHVQAVAARQVLSRIVNERIVQLSDGAAAPGAGLAVVCECGNDGCFERIELTKGEYDAIRENGRRFVLLPGHEIAAHERVVERRTATSSPSELFHPLLARAHDGPRTAPELPRRRRRRRPTSCSRTSSTRRRGSSSSSSRCSRGSPSSRRRASSRSGSGGASTRRSKSSVPPLAARA